MHGLMIRRANSIRAAVAGYYDMDEYPAGWFRYLAPCLA